MIFDVCLVSYNSCKWLENCIKALASAALKVEKVNIYLADNASSDGTIAEAERLRRKYQNAFGNFVILPQNSNKGFGAGCNTAAKSGCGEYVFFCNLDTEIFEDALFQLSLSIEKSASEFAAFEMRQIPYEHPKYYDPVTLETAWASGACVAIRRTAFEAVGGFDENLFMYGEDVELSLHLRLEGFRIRYIPDAIIKHYAYQVPGEGKPLQEAGSLVSNLYLRSKYGTNRDVALWKELYQTSVVQYTNNPHYQSVPQLAAEMLQTLRPRAEEQRKFYRKHVKPKGFDAGWDGLSYAFARGGAFFEVCPPKPTIRFSVLVRAYRRPDSLALTLKSLENQTYRNFEVVVAEDGTSPVCAPVVHEAAKALSIIYLPLAQNAGRSAAGNAAIKAASGDWLVFLDDDDFFFADHLEALAQCVLAHPDCGMVAMGSVEAKAKRLSDRTVCTLHRRNRMPKRFSLARQCIENYFPIQTVAFQKELPQRYGGMDETLDALEDWDLWTRYACHATIYLGQKCTSVYHVPAEDGSAQLRAVQMEMQKEKLIERWKDYPLPPLCAATLLESVLPAEPIVTRNDLAELRQTAQRLVKSRRWKITAPLRMVFCLLDLLAGRKNKTFARWRCYVGPSLPDIENADESILCEFITNVRISLCWRITTRH